MKNYYTNLNQLRQSNDGQPTVKRQSRLMLRQGYLRNLAMIFAVLVLSMANIGMAWGANVDVTSSNFYQFYSTTKNIDAATLITNASLPSYITTTISATQNGTLSTNPSITSPHDFSSLGTSTKYWRLKTGSNKITITAVSNLKKVRFYGNGSSSTRNITTAVTKVSGSGSAFTVATISSIPNSNATIAEYSTVDFTAQTGYDASTYYTYVFTFSGDVSLWGIYVEAGAAVSTDYYYRGSDNSFDATKMTTSAGGKYSYIASTSSTNKFKIALSASTWDYNHDYNWSGFCMTDQDINLGDFGGDDCYIWDAPSSYYIIIFHPNTNLNSSSNPHICVSRTLPDDTDAGLSVMKTIYLDPGTWATGGDCKYAIQYYAHNEDWSGYMTASPCFSGLYQVDIPAIYSNVIFVRLNPSGDISWKSKWNQTGDLESMPAGRPKFTIDLENSDWNSAYISSSKWTNTGISTYTITYAGNGNTGGSMANVEGIACNGSTTLAANAFEKTGHTFANWKTNVAVTANGVAVAADGAVSNEAVISNITGNITLTAQWTPKTYTITLNGNGGSGNTSSVTATYNSSTLSSSITNPTLDCYTFDGWYSGEGGSGTLIINTSGVLQASTTYTGAGGIWTNDGAVTLYAKWSKTPTALTVNLGGDPATPAGGSPIGTEYTLTCSASTGVIASYQWKQNTTASTAGAVNAEGTGATTASFNPVPAAAGTYYYYCVATDACGNSKNTSYSGAFQFNEPADPCSEPAEVTNEIARFFVPCGTSTSTAFPTTEQNASTGDNTFIVSGYGTSSDNLSRNATTGFVYGKLTGSSSYIQLTLNESGKFRAGDVVTAYVNSNSNALQMNTGSAKAFGTQSASGNDSEYQCSITLAADNIESDGSIKIKRSGSIYVNRIIVTREPACFEITDAKKPGSGWTDRTSSAQEITSSMLKGTISGGTVLYSGTGTLGANETYGLVFDNNNDEITITLSGTTLPAGALIVIGARGRDNTNSHQCGFVVSGNSMSPATTTSSTSGNSFTQTYTVKASDGIIGGNTFTIKRVTDKDKTYLESLYIIGCEEASCADFTVVRGGQESGTFTVGSYGGSALTCTPSPAGSYTYAWKQYPTAGGTPETAVSAEGTGNNTNSFTPNPASAGTYIYFCDVTDACSTTKRTSLTGAFTFNAAPAFTASTSVNIEQGVLTNSKKWDYQSALTAANITSDLTTCELDSLNDACDKTDRNNDYLGLKIKAGAKYIQMNVPSGKTLKVRFGKRAAAVNVWIDGVAQDNIPTTGNYYTYELASSGSNRVVKIATADGNAVVIKQIMIGEEIASVTLPAKITLGGTTNGTISVASTKVNVGSTVTVTATPTSGYELSTLTYTKACPAASEPVNIDKTTKQFTMPNGNVTINATFAAACSAPTTAFANGSYTIGGSALDLSTLISSNNSSGAITYTVKYANGTGATIVGTSFSATVAGTATVTATQAANGGHCEKVMDATITVSAPAATLFTVTFAYNGATDGNGTANVTQASAGANVTLPTPTKDGYTFQGWYLSDGTKAGNGGGSYRPTANVTVYALWRAKCDAVSGGTATFNFNDGTATGLTIGTNGANASYSITNSKYQSKISALDSYFLGVSFTGNSSGVITITTSESYTDIQSISFNSASTDHSNPSIEIYTVNGDTETKQQNAITLSSGSNNTWRESANTIDLSSTQPDGKVRFKLTTGSSGRHAGIDNIQIVYGGDGGTCYYVTYNGNGATGGFTTDETAYEEGNNVTVAANGYTRSGYTFNGWNTAADGSGTAYSAGGTISSISGNVTLYAQWEEIVDVDGACWDPASTVTDKLTSGDVTLTTLTNKFAGLSGVTVTVPNPGTENHESGGSDDNSGYLKVKNASSSGTQVIQIVTTKAIDVTFGCEKYGTNAGSFYLVASGDLSTKIATCTTGNEVTKSDLPAGTYYIYALPTSNNKSLNFSKLCISDHGCTSTPTTVRWTVQPAGGVVGKADQVVTAVGADGTTSFTYSSANTEVATIVEGNKVHLVGAGTTYLIATGTDACGNALESRSDEFTVLGRYSITYNLNGGAWGGVEHKETYTPMDEEYTLPTPTKDSYTFGGWYEDEELTEGPVTKIYTNTSGNKTYWAKWGTNLSATWSVTKVDSKLYRGGGGYSVTVYLNQADWDASGNKDDLDLSATEGVTLKNIVKSINGEGKAQVAADFDITTALAADATAITFTLDVPAAGAYVATELEREEALNDCAGSSIEWDFNAMSAKKFSSSSASSEGNKNAISSTTGDATMYYFAGSGDEIKKLNVGGDPMVLYLNGKVNSGSVGVNSTYTTRCFYIDITSNGTLTIENNTEANGRPSYQITGAIRPGTSGYTNASAKGTGDDAYKYDIAVSTYNASTACRIWVAYTSNKAYINKITWTPTGGGGAVSTTLSWDPALTNGGSVTKDIADPDFTYAAVKSNNSLGVVSYTSSNTSVATVNAAGKVHAVAEGTTTITATLPASGCFLGTSITYELTVVNNCAEAEGTITNADDEPIAGDAVKLSACGSYVLKLSGYKEGATIKWYKDDEEITGQTEPTLTVDEAGVYYAITHVTCDVTSANSITVTKLASTVTAEKVVDSWYVKNGRRTPDIALVKTTAAVNFTVKTGGTVIWNSDGTVTTGFGGCGFYLGADGIIYLKGTKDNGDATTGLTGSTDVTLTITVSGECATVNDLNVIIHCQAETTRPSIAFVVDGTKKGAFTAASADHSTNSALYKFLDYGDDSKGAFDLTACNIYSTTDEKAIRQHYSQFDAILITDNPSTQETPGGDYKSKGYVNAFGTMIDVRPILTMEAYVSALKNWSCVKGNPTSPNPRQYALRLECKDHEIYNEGLPSPKAGTHVWDESSDDGDELYRYVILVDSTKGAYNGVAYNEQTDGKELPALQGFTYAASGNMLGLGRISEGSLQAAIERQEETAARMLVFGINAKALPNALTEEGKQIIENILKYLLKTNMEEVDDCSNYFTGKVDNLWSNTANWSKNSLPTYETKARILASCQLSGTAYVAQVDIASSGKSQRMKNHLGSGDGSCNGALTIAADGALVVAGKVRSAEAPHFATNDLMPTTPANLYIAADETKGNGTLIFDNEDGETQATVGYYSKATTDENTTWNWQYMAVPFNDNSSAYRNYYDSYLYRWKEDCSGWEVVENRGEVYPWVGYTITQVGQKMYYMDGTLVETGEQTFTVPAGKNLVVGNSWTAPIQVKQFEDADFTGMSKNIYLFNTGYDPNGEGTFDKDDGRYEGGTYVTVPIHASPYTGDSLISSLQAFTVYATGGGGGGTFTLNYDRHIRPARTTDNLSAGPMHAPKRGGVIDDKPAVLKVWASGSRYDDRLVVLEREDFSTGLDEGWDGNKRVAGNSSPLIFAVTDNGREAVSAIPTMEGTLIGFWAGEDNEYTLHFEYNEEDELYLLDLDNNTYTPVNSNSTYVFTVPDKKAHNRFILTYNAPDPVATGVEETQANEKPEAKAIKFLKDEKVFIFVNGKLYDATGKIVK